MPGQDALWESTDEMPHWNDVLSLSFCEPALLHECVCLQPIFIARGAEASVG